MPEILTILTSADGKTTGETCIVYVASKGHHVLTLWWVTTYSRLFEGQYEFFLHKTVRKIQRNGMRNPKASNDHVTLAVVDGRDQPHIKMGEGTWRATQPKTQSGLCKKKLNDFPWSPSARNSFVCFCHHMVNSKSPTWNPSIWMTNVVFGSSWWIPGEGELEDELVWENEPFWEWQQDFTFRCFRIGVSTYQLVFEIVDSEIRPWEFPGFSVWPAFDMSLWDVFEPWYGQLSGDESLMILVGFGRRNQTGTVDGKNSGEALRIYETPMKNGYSPYQAPAPSKWPFDNPNGGHLTSEKVT